MKKKNFVILVLIILIVFVIVKKDSFISIYEFDFNGINYAIEIPQKTYSIKNKNFNIMIKSFDSLKNIESFKEKYLKKIEQTCEINGIKYYYDNSQNITIYNYKISKNLISKTISFDYYIGHYCNYVETKEIEEENKKLNFEIFVNPSLSCDKLIKQLYPNVHTYCLDNISIKKENETFSLDEALLSEIVSIDEITKKFEFEYKYAEGMKEEYKDAIVYSNYNYKMIVCKNQEKYIIGDKKLVYDEKNCY